MRLVPMRLGLLILLAVFLVLAVSVYALRSPGPSVVFRAPGLGPIDHVCVSLYGWAPNGSLVKLGKACGTGGEVKLPFNGVEAYLEAWRRSLEAEHDNPDWIEPGLIALVADTRPGIGVYGYIKAVAVNITRTLATKRLTISLTGDETRTMMAKPLVQWREIASHAAEWPPRSLPSTQPLAHWELLDVLASETNTPIPLAIVRLKGYLKHFTDDTALLHEYLATDREVKLTFSALAAIEAGPVTIYLHKWEVAGPVLTISPPISESLLSLTLAARYRDDAKPLYTGTGLDDEILEHDVDITAKIKPMGPNGDVLLAVGYRGDVAVAEYCLRVPLIPKCMKKALLVLHRPKLAVNLMYYWYEVDNNPEDGKGLAAKVFYSIMNSVDWAPGWNDTKYGDYSKTYNTLANDYHTSPILSITIPVGAILGAKGATGVAASLVLVATVGTQSKYVGVSVIYMHFDAINDPDIVYSLEGLHPTHKVYYKGHIYQLGATYYDVEVIKPGSLPPVPPGGAYPTKKIPAAPS